jgi:hypothetical protein
LGGEIGSMTQIPLPSRGHPLLDFARCTSRSA